MGLAAMGAYVKQRREAMGLTQTELASAVGIVPSYLSKIERGASQYKEVGREVLRRLAAALGEDESRLEALLYDRPLPRALGLRPFFPVVLRVVGQSHAGRRGPVEGFVFVDPDEVAGRQVLAVRVEGACLEPYVHPGDVVILDKRKEPEEGDAVVVRFGDRVVIAICAAEGGRPTLRTAEGTVPEAARDGDAGERIGVVLYVQSRWRRLRRIAPLPAQVLPWLALAAGGGAAVWPLG
jgi:transcriptional regulator with XRE-family HTH domain